MYDFLDYPLACFYIHFFLFHACSILWHPHKEYLARVWREKTMCKRQWQFNAEATLARAYAMHACISSGSCRCVGTRIQDRSTTFLSLARTEGDGIGVAEMYCKLVQTSEKARSLAKDRVASTYQHCTYAYTLVIGRRASDQCTLEKTKRHSSCCVKSDTG